MIKYSVIIPIYNSEKTLERCLNSLAPQLREDIEILLIDDGSTDNSRRICERFVSGNDSFKYWHQENSGVSAARNLGLDNASGKYILFVDSDDHVSDDYFKEIDGVLDEYEPDMVLFGMSFSSRDIGYGDFARRFKGIRKDVPLMISVLLQRQLAHSLLSKVFLRSVIADNGLRFDADLRISEDLLFNFKYMLSAKSIAIIDKELYFVDESSNDSLTRKARDYLADELIRANLGMFASLDESGLDDDAKATIRKTLSWMFYRSAYSSCMELLKYDLTATERRRRIKYICRKFNLQKIGFHGIKGAVAALPVNLCLSFLIDLIVRFRCRRRG